MREQESSVLQRRALPNASVAMKNRTPVPRDHLPPIPPFTPVPRRYRHDGWTSERQRAFIAALADTGSVSAAAARINMSSEGAYYLRRQPGAESFSTAWDAALDFGIRSLADLAIDRARHGVAVPIFHKGEQVGEKRWYNDRLLMFVLRHHLPDKYGLQLNGGTRSKATIEREAAENCPTCRQAQEAAEEEDSNEAKAAWFDRIMKRYLIKVQQEQDERRKGRWYAADFYLRQPTHIELILDVGGRTQAMLDACTANPERPDDEPYASPVSEILAKHRAAVWAAAGDPPRPPLRLARVLPSDSITSGSTYPARQHARTACEQRIAAAQGEWEATRTEESWAAWCGGRGS